MVEYFDTLIRVEMWECGKAKILKIDTFRGRERGAPD